MRAVIGKVWRLMMRWIFYELAARTFGAFEDGS